MEDIVALKIRDKIAGTFFVLTWGRTFDPVRPEPLISAVETALSKRGINQILAISLCNSLLEASRQEYFYECFAMMIWEKPPFGKATHRDWCESINRKISLGKELYYLGFKKEKPKPGKKRGI